MTKEECLTELANAKYLDVVVENQYGVFEFKSKFGDTYICKLFEQLIEEHFNPKPLSLEWFKDTGNRNVWIWDDVFKLPIYFVKYEEKCLMSIRCRAYFFNSLSQNIEEKFQTYYDGDRNLGLEKRRFEENRFYPLTKANQEK